LCEGTEPLPPCPPVARSTPLPPCPLLSSGTGTLTILSWGTPPAALASPPREAGSTDPLDGALRGCIEEQGGWELESRPERGAPSSWASTTWAEEGRPSDCFR